MASTYHLIVAIPDQEPISYTINANTVTIGRSPENDIQILIREVSTAHCELSGDKNGYEIVDKGSSNGTRVKGQGIRNGRVFLNHHDKVVFGETVPAYFVIAQNDERFSVKDTIAGIEKAEQEKIAAASAAAPEKPIPVPATHATAAQAGSSTQVLKKKPTLPPLRKPSTAAKPPAKKVPALSRPTADKPKIPALKKPGPVAAVQVVEVVEEVVEAAPAKPKVPALSKPAPAKKSVPTLSRPGSAAPSSKPAVPKLAKPGGNSAPKKVPTLSKPGATPEASTPEKKKVPKLNLPKKGE